MTRPERRGERGAPQKGWISDAEIIELMKEIFGDMERSKRSLRAP
jgi:hypothetical protein